MEFRQLHKHPSPITLYNFRLNWGVRLDLLKDRHPTQQERFTLLFKVTCYHLFEIMAYYNELIHFNKAITDELTALDIKFFEQNDPKANPFQQTVSTKPTKVKKKKLKAEDRKLLANYLEQFEYASEACVNDQVANQRFIARYAVDYDELEVPINRFVFDTHLHDFKDSTQKTIDSCVQYLFQIFDNLLVYYTNLYEQVMANKYLLAQVKPEHELLTEYNQLEPWQPTTVVPKVKSKSEVDINIVYGTGFANFPADLELLAKQEVALQAKGLNLKLEKLRRTIDSQRLKIDSPYIRVPRPSIMAGDLKQHRIANLSNFITKYYEKLAEEQPHYSDIIDVDRFLILIPYVVNYCVVKDYSESSTKEFLDKYFTQLIEDVVISGNHEKYRDHTYDFLTGGKLPITKTMVPVLYELANVNTRVRDEKKILTPLSEMLDSRLVEEKERAAKAAEQAAQQAQAADGSAYPATVTEVLNLANREAEAKTKVELPDSVTSAEVSTTEQNATPSNSTTKTATNSKLEFPLPSKSTPKSTSLELEFPVEPLQAESGELDLPVDPFQLWEEATAEAHALRAAQAARAAQEAPVEQPASAPAETSLAAPTAKAKSNSAKEKEKARLAREKEKAKAKLSAEKAKEKEKLRLAKEKEKEKARLAKEKEKARLQLEKEKAKAKLAAEKAKEKEKARLAKEKEKARLAKEKEKVRLAKEKEKEKIRQAKEKAKAKLEAEKAKAKAKIAAEREKEKLRLAKLKENVKAKK